MTLRKPSLLVLAALALAGCGDKEAREAERAANPTFMFFNYRDEIVAAEYRVPDMRTSTAATYLQMNLKRVPGYVDSEYDLARNILTVRYKSSTIRKMNFEEAIAAAGFSVNNRPAKPGAKIPQGVK